MKQELEPTAATPLAEEVSEETPIEAEFKGPVAAVNTAPDLFNQVFERMTRTGAGALKGGEIIRRRKLSFVVEGAICAPDVFTDANGEYYDFKVTLRQLSARDEAEALSGLTDAAMAPSLLAKATLYAINDKPLARDADKLDFLWEALGMGGRQLVMLGSNTLGSVSASALGKYQATITIS